MSDPGERSTRDMVIEHDTQLKDLMGNGNPGRIRLMEDDIKDLINMKWKIVGFIVGLVFLMEGAHAGFKEILALLH